MECVLESPFSKSPHNSGSPYRELHHTFPSPLHTATTRYKEMECPSAPGGPGVFLRGGEKRGNHRQDTSSVFLSPSGCSGCCCCNKQVQDARALAVPVSILECAALCSSALLSLLLKATNGPAPVMKHTLAFKAISWDFQGSLLSGSFGGSRSYGHTLLQVVGKGRASRCWQQRRRKSQGCMHGQGPTRVLYWSSLPMH